ncbi:HAMP domain-containing protein [Desulfobacterales bacterium HSG17]|nr:HAMP domain-containing protein [Desulfobacterales bacterium HSG17]
MIFSRKDKLDEGELLKAMKRFRKGDFSVRLPAGSGGQAGEIAETFNDMVIFAGRCLNGLQNVSDQYRETGELKNIKIPPSAEGEWENCYNSANDCIDELNYHFTWIIDITDSLFRGDFSKSMPDKYKGMPLSGKAENLSEIFNKLISFLNVFIDDLNSTAYEMGVMGHLDVRMDAGKTSGIWRDTSQTFNTMLNNLTAQVRNIAEVTTAVAKGDLTRKITIETKGEVLELKKTINTMVDQLSLFANEVTRVSREVGTEGRLGGQAVVEGVSGTWRDLTGSVNLMAENLTAQVRNIAEVTTAVAQGDLARKITIDARGEVSELKETINNMVDQLSRFANEVTRVSREVGTKGQLGGQAVVEGVSGTWRDLTDNVNLMADNLTAQVRNIADVTTAVANGNLTRKITIDARGEILALKETINTMVEQLSRFANEVTRVSRDVGTEGRLGGQAVVEGVSGTWRDLTTTVNDMAENLTAQVRNIAEVTTAVARGDLTRKITIDARGEVSELKETINNMVDQLSRFANEVTRVSREVGTDGRLGGQAVVEGVSGTWRDLTDNVNLMADNLTAQVRSIAEVTTAVAKGDLTRKITIDASGEILELKSTINIMVEHLRLFADEVTRVSREVGIEGKLGGQAVVKEVSGTWRALTDNVNNMADNLTEQVRGIASVVTQVARGNLKKKLRLSARGEIAELAETINNMIDTLSLFTDQVTTVAREVGTEGRLGGQASVEDAEGIWRALTDNVNQLAQNLTTQVRAIHEVATAVTQGDLSRTISVEARGEVESLKINLNKMIENLRETTLINTEQDWLKTSMAHFNKILQGQRNYDDIARSTLSELVSIIPFQQGAFYIKSYKQPETLFILTATYALEKRKNLIVEISPGQGLAGQCIKEKKRILLTNAPADYISVKSSLGESQPICIAVIPVLYEDQVIALIELASFEKLKNIQLFFLEQLAETLGVVLNTVRASMKTENLLTDSQSMTSELQNQQDRLSQANEDLKNQADFLEHQKKELEIKNTEIEKTQTQLKEKADQLSLTSKYKSQFLANMSHELRTPLNSLLIMAQLLAENKDKNLSKDELKQAEIIHSSGRELLNLINEILDLAKIESGIMTIEKTGMSVKNMLGVLKNSFESMLKQKGIEFKCMLDEKVPEVLYTDENRLLQILKNLLSNAFKFTEQGTIQLKIYMENKGWSHDNDNLNRADAVIAMSVSDTGMGIPEENHLEIFEAFQQVDGSISRKHGGTGLGLAISREIAGYLSGELRLAQSKPGQGSTFTFYIPVTDPDTVKEPANEDLSSPLKESESSYSRIGEKLLNADQVYDDRNNIQEDDVVLLIIEDDEKFGKAVLEIVHEMDYKGIVTSNGENGLKMAEKIKPAGIFLDLALPGINGLIVLDRIKHNPELCHVPVYIISGDPDTKQGRKFGAAEIMGKPVSLEKLRNLIDKIPVNTENGKNITCEADKILEGKKVLVVDDEMRNIFAITAVLERENLEIIYAESGKEAIDLLNNNPDIDIMLLDIMMPEMDGFEVIKQVRENDRFKSLPVIAVTAKTMPGDREKCLQAGATDYISKPINNANLVSVIRVRLYDE